MISDQPPHTRALDLDPIAESLSASLLELPGLVRLEPTVRSVVHRLKLTTEGGRQMSATRDGLQLTVAGDKIDVQADIATNVAHRALSLAESIQVLIAEKIHLTGLSAGRINVRILAIEGGPSD